MPTPRPPSARPTGRPSGRSATFRQSVALVGGFVVLLWLLELVDTAVDHRLDGYGIRPRSDEGLTGVLLAPLLHGGWEHLAANTVPVAVLGMLVLLAGVLRGVVATLVIWAVAGLGVWLVGDAWSIHLGASSLVFGWLAYLVLRGFFTRSLWQVLVGIAVFALWGGMLLGVLPGQPGISWEGHLFGAVGGGLAAVWLGRKDL